VYDKQSESIVVVALTLVALILVAVEFICLFILGVSIYFYLSTVFYLIDPMSVLIINMAVVREVCRRASNDAATSLGLQHQQSTTFNSAVPTVMLVTSSIVYFLLFGLGSITFLLHRIFRINIWANVYVYYITHAGWPSFCIHLQLLCVPDHRQAVSFPTTQTLLLLLLSFSICCC